MQLTTTTPINCPTQRAWEIIAEDFGDTATWASSMSSSRLDRDQVEVGATRVGQVGKRQVNERITAIDRNAHTFSYELVDPPAIIERAVNTWTIRETGPTSCEVSNEMEMALHRFATPLSPLLKFAIQKQLAGAIEEFTVYAETGTPHKRALGKR